MVYFNTLSISSLNYCENCPLNDEYGTYCCKRVLRRRYGFACRPPFPVNQVPFAWLVLWKLEFVVVEMSAKLWSKLFKRKSSKKIINDSDAANLFCDNNNGGAPNDNIIISIKTKPIVPGASLSKNYNSNISPSGRRRKEQSLLLIRRPI